MHQASLAVLLPLLLGCACDRPPPVGYDGPLPSVAARSSLEALIGRTLPAGSVVFCAHELRVHSFLVTPTMPAVVVDEAHAHATGAAARHWIPVLQDGDIADLHRRITGAAPAGMPTTTSDAYRRMVDGR